MKIISILIYSSLYAIVVLYFLIFLFRKTRYGWLKFQLNRKLRNWLILNLLIGIALAKLSFSYWQFTGLGDYPELPIGYKQRVYCPDFAFTYFFPDLNKTNLNSDEIAIEKFAVKKSILCAEIANQEGIPSHFSFLVYDLQTKKSIFFENEIEYNNYTRVNNLPRNDELNDFKKNYLEFFDKQSFWRIYLIP